MDDATKRAYLEFFSRSEAKELLDSDLELKSMLDSLKQTGDYQDTQLCYNEFSKRNLNIKNRTLGYKMPYVAQKTEYYYQAHHYVHRYNFDSALERYVCTAYTLGLTHQKISDRVKEVHSRLGIFKPVSRSTVQRSVAEFNRKLRLFLDAQARGLREVK